MSCSLVILGAGLPHHGNRPTALREPHSGISTLQWVLDATGCTIDAVTFVAGYRADSIRVCYPKLKVIENHDWEHTGSGASLLASSFATDVPLLVCYSDILFRAKVTKALEGSDADIVVAWDSFWQARYSCRKTEDLIHSEKVVVDSGGWIKSLGADIALEQAAGEFIGLVRFSPRVLNFLKFLGEDALKKLRQCHLAEYIEYLRKAGFLVKGVDVFGDWAEFNEPRDIARFILGTKAETLARLRGMVRYAVIQDQVAFTSAQWQASRTTVLDQIYKKFSGLELAVRSSARSEDTFSCSNAGGFDSVLNVDQKSGLEPAIEQVIASYGNSDENDQVLVQPMVANVAISGVAFTRTLDYGAAWYVINYETSGDTEAITSGKSKDHRTLLLRRDIALSKIPEPQLQALVEALREIEALLCYDALDVEFALDFSGSVYILQVRPIAVGRTSNNIDDVATNAIMAAAHARWKTLRLSPPHLPGEAPPLYGVMPDWNPAEIIGTVPGALATSLYRYLIMDEVWATQRAEFGYWDVRPAPLLVEFAGRPYVDVRASFASFLPAELSEDLSGRLLEFYLEWLAQHPEFHDKVEFEVVPTCLAPGFGNWEQRLRVDGSFSDEDVMALRAGLRGITMNAIDRYESDLAEIENLSDQFESIQSDTDIAPIERARILLDDCRQLGTLPFAHLARCGFIAVTLLREAETCGIISNTAIESFFSTLRTVGHRLTADARATAYGEMSWDFFVARYGHLRPGTYDITSPRYDADPNCFLRPLVEHARVAVVKKDNLNPWHVERASFVTALIELGLAVDLDGVESFLRKTIEGREYAKFIFTRNLSAALESIAEVGAHYGMGREDLAKVPLDIIFSLNLEARSDEDIKKELQRCAKEGAYQESLASACELPVLITKEIDLDTFIIRADQPNFIGSGSISAACIHLKTQSASEQLELLGKIVVIPQADPGYDWLFGQGIAGLVTQYGGANSHMAIRAAEFGLPAVIGIGEQRYRELAVARMLELSPSNRVLRVIQ